MDKKNLGLVAITAIGIYAVLSAVVHYVEYYPFKMQKFYKCLEYCDEKPMLNIGCVWTCPKTCIDNGINVDVMPCPKEKSNFLRCDATKLPFEDKKFGCLFASHVLEHMENPKEALREWERVSEKQVILTPYPFLAASFHPDHKWLSLIGENPTTEDLIRIPFR